MKILFMGTPEFAVYSLNALIDAGHELCGVLTQPDRPKNRGMKQTPPPVKVCALAHGIPVFQPNHLKNPDIFHQIQALDPELIVVAAYGHILPKEILAYPKFGCINVHASLLPKFRGAAPINWAVLSGETETGVTIMDMSQTLDAGDILSQRKTAIGQNDTVEELYHRLAKMGAEQLVETVIQIADGTVCRVPQDSDKATFAPMLSRAFSPIDWTWDAKTIYQRIRGLLPWPVASTDILTGTPIKIFASERTGDTAVGTAAGTILSAGKQGIDVVCGDGAILRLTMLQPSGGKRMAAADYLRGHPIIIDRP